MLLRLGFYLAMCERYFHDSTYIRKWYGHVEDITDEEILRILKEMHDRFIVAKIIKPDEDPFEVERLRK